jgi:hypothetical protein
MSAPGIGTYIEAVEPNPTGLEDDQPRPQEPLIQIQSAPDDHDDGAQPSGSGSASGSGRPPNARERMWPDLPPCHRRHHIMLAPIRPDPDPPAPMPDHQPEPTWTPIPRSAPRPFPPKKKEWENWPVI